MRLNLHYVIGALMFIMLIQGCEREEIVKDREYPRLDMSEEVVQDQFGIIFEGIFLTRKGEIEDKGFVWDLNNPSLYGGSRLSVGEGYADGFFEGKALFDLDEGQEYQVKAYIIHEGTTVYSKPVTFTSSTSGTPHSLESFSPRTGLHNDTLLISGINLSYKPERITVLFNNSTANIHHCSDTTITVTVPPSLSEHESLIEVTINGVQKSFTDAFSLTGPVIEEIQPRVVTSAGEQITILGSGFNPLKENNMVQLGSYFAQVVNASSTSLSVTVPDSLVADPEVSLDTIVPVRVSVAGSTALSPDSLGIDYKSIWTRMKDFPGNPRKLALSFGNGSRGFYGLGSNLDETQFFTDLWEYIPDTDTWTERASFPGASRIHSATFTLGNILFLIGGSIGDPSLIENHSLETWAYNMDTDQWTRLNDFTGTARIRAEGFAAGGDGFMISGCHESDTMSLEVWKYLPGSDTWERNNDLENVEPMTHEQFLLRAYTNGETGIILCKAQAHYNVADTRVYDHLSDTWNGIGFSWWYEGTPPGCYHDGLIYMGPTYYQGLAEFEQIYVYDNVDSHWTYLDGFKGSARRDACSFSIGNRLYFFGGLSGAGDYLLNDMWMFDLSIN